MQGLVYRVEGRVRVGFVVHHPFLRPGRHVDLRHFGVHPAVNLRERYAFDDARRSREPAPLVRRPRRPRGALLFLRDGFRGQARHEGIFYVAVAGW